MSDKKSNRRAGIESSRARAGYMIYRGTYYDRRLGKKIRGPWTTSLAEAKAWRVDAQAAAQAAAERPASARTVKEAATEWLELAAASHARNRTGDPYKPSVIRSYRGSFETHVYPVLGGTPMDQIDQPMLYRLIERWQLDGFGASSIRNAMTALRVVLRHAAARGEITANPCSGLRLPAGRGRRDRVADPAEAERLVAALPPFERVLYATAIYAGLRRGELAGLRWSDLDLTRGTLRVERSYDFVARVYTTPKSAAGVRVVPMATRLRELLVERGLDNRVASNDPVFGPFNPRSISKRADAAFKAAGERRITLHECRHTYASLSVAAGVAPKELQASMGHASIGITMDRYAHLWPTSVDVFRTKLDDYLG